MLIERMLRAARLDPDLYYEVERSESLTPQAFGVVLIAALGPLVGALLTGQIHPLGLIPAAMWGGVMALGYWVCWAAIAQAIGARLGARGPMDGVLRTSGFAHAPGVLRVFAFLPGLGSPVHWIALLWTGAAMVTAMRETMRFDTKKAVLIVLAASLIMAIIDYLLASLTGATRGAVGFVLSPLWR